MKTAKFLFLIFAGILLSQSWICPLFAQDAADAALRDQILKAKNASEIQAAFTKAKDSYFQNNKYNDFTDFLKTVVQKKKSLEVFADYYTALARYQQLKFLEETQGWDEYFSKGNEYREGITSGLDKVIKSAGEKEPLAVYSRLLSWQFHADQQDALAEDALSDLIKSVYEYAEGSKDLVPVKDVADRFLAYQQRAHAKEIYKIYIGRISSGEATGCDLEAMIVQFYNEGNIELAQTVADVFLERLAKSDSKEKSVSSLINIARLFAYKDEGPKDAFYAEKVFKKIEEMAGNKPFDEELTYLRSFNAEKAKEYDISKSYYLDLLARFPQTVHFDEAEFKAGIISAYVLRDVKSAKADFERLAAKETLSPQVISSLYHLGLLSQWEQDPTKAKQYYEKLIERAKDNFGETVSMAKDRLEEIKEEKPLDYNTRLFIDMALKDEYATFAMSKLDMKSDFYQAAKGKQVNISSTAYPPQSGCIQVTLEYLWSGDLGKTVPTNQDNSFSTSYSDSGTKVVWLIATTPSGIIDRNLDFIDIGDGS
jgi:TolA-binding protein